MKEDLLNLIKKYSLATQATELFWYMFENYKKHEKEEFATYFKDYSEDKIQLIITSISYELTKWPELEGEQLVVYISVVYDKFPTGRYIIYFDMDGNVKDDMFKIY